MKDYTLTLKNGSKLGVLEVGDLDSNNVVFYFHGFPGCRLDSMIFQELAPEKHIRIIALDRPGYGNSDFIDGMSIANFPAIFKEVTELLNINSCKVFGISGGTPYAMACTAKYPDIVQKLCIVSGVSEVKDDAVFEGMTASNKIFLKLGRNHPSLVKPFAHLISYIWAANVNVMLKWMKLFMAKPDRELLSDKGNAQFVLQGLKEGLKQGSKVVVQEFMRLCADWGFSPSEIKVPTHFWHGEVDCYIPLPMGKKNSSLIPQSELTAVPGGGHLVVVNILNDILNFYL